MTQISKPLTLTGFDAERLLSKQRSAEDNVHQQLHDEDELKFKPVEKERVISPTVGEGPKEAFFVDDIDGLRKRIFAAIIDKFKNLPALKYGDYELKIENIELPEKRYHIKDEVKAILNSGQLDVPIHGEFVLKNNKTGQEMRRRALLARVPYMTNHGTFIVNGVSYAIANQLRLRPGIYVRVRDNGEVEALVAASGARAHHYELDPVTSKFTLRFGNRSIPLLSVLRALGVSDEAVARTWGRDVFAANAAAARPTDILKLFDAKTPEAANQALKEWIDSVWLDPNVTRITLGTPYSRANAEAILKATEKMLKVYRGEAPPDERDDLFFQKVAGPEHFFAERIPRVHAQMKKYILRAVRKGNLDVIPSNVYGQAIDDVIYGSGLGELLDEINPGEVLDRLYRVVKTGEGGISDPRRITEAPRNIYASQMGYIDPVVTGAQMKTGVDNRLSWMVRRDPEGNLYTLFRDVKKDQLVWRSPNDIVDSVIAFPGSLKTGKPFIPALYRGEMKYVPIQNVDLELVAFPQIFSVVANWIPFPNTTFPHRLMMGSKMHLQALPLVNREEPLVQTKHPFEDTSFLRKYASFFGARYSPVEGRVASVDKDSVIIEDASGKEVEVDLYNNYPFNRKTFIHNEPLVKPGDIVKKDQLIAASNYTDKSGNPAFGLNAYVAYMPYYGYSYEDAIVISESFAKRLASEHMYQDQLDLDKNIKTGKAVFRSAFPGKYPDAFYEKYDDNGVIRPGTIVQPNQPLILAVKEPLRMAGYRRIFNDASVAWNKPFPGEVIYAHKTDKYYYVATKMIAPAVEGDKLVGRVGDKGVIGTIVPDEKMPRDKEGKPFDVLLNPLGIITRTNVGQVYEAVLGKVANKTGKPIFAPYDIENAWEYVKDMAEKHGVQLDDTVVDPETGKEIPGVLTGYRYIMRLHHTAESKLQERETGEYTSEEMPSRGGKAGAKKIGIMELMALLGHGAYQVIRDAKLIRGQRNEDFWLAFMRGQNPPIDKVPLVYEKFLTQLRGAGINVVTDNRGIHVMALTNDDIKSLAGPRELRNAETVAVKKGEIQIVPGGLFDEEITGGLDGSHWSYFKLAEPMPSPVMEGVIRSLIGVTANEYESILAGKAPIPGTRLTGPDGLYEYLKDFNVDASLAQARAEMKSLLASGKTSGLDDVVRKVRHLESIKKTGQHPSQWFWDRMPVIPAKFRPISLTEKTLLVSDINALYQDVWDANSILSQAKRHFDDIGMFRTSLYKAMKAVAGIGNPIQIQHKKQELSGFLKQLAGDSVKFNYVLRKLAGFTVDVTGRAVIIPNPGLDIDHVGLPIEQAWTLYRRFIIRNLVRSGLTLTDALRQYKSKSEVAKRELLTEMKRRPVIINRAPTLHRYGMMAFWPVLIKGKVVEFNPFVCKTFGADYDGDAVQIHVPVSQEAVEEAINKMLPSRNLLSSATFGINYPINQEFLLGLWLATSQKKPGAPQRKFSSLQELAAAFKRGEIDVGTPVVLDSSELR